MSARPVIEVSHIRRTCGRTVAVNDVSFVPNGRSYPLLGLSGLFYPIERMPPVLQTLAAVSPLTYAVSLLDGIWKGESWFAHGTDIAALVLTFVICTAISAGVFRWE